MTEIFLFGTLCHAPLLHAVAGEQPAMRPAVLPDATVARVAGQPYPMLVERAGAQAHGVVIDVSDAALARLDFYEACFGYVRKPVTVHLEGNARAAEVWRPAQATGQPDGPWSLADWARDWGDLATIAAHEVLRQRATATAQEVGARYWMIAARAQAQLSAGAWRRPALIGRNLPRDAVDPVAHRFPYSRFYTVEEIDLRH